MPGVPAPEEFLVTQPSTDWKEVVAPGESELFERLAQDLARLQAKVGAKRGSLDRGLHAKSNAAARAQFEVLADVPAHLKVGLFAAPRTYDAVVRFSNGGPGRQADRRPDVRGIGVKVLGVDGKKLIPGMEDCRTQDFLAILSATTPFRSPEEFVWLVTNAGNPLTLLPKALLHLGPARALKLLGQLQKGLGAPLTALHGNTYYSALPIRFGPYAAKYRFVPDGVASTPADVDADLGEALLRRLDAGPLRWHFEVQLFSDEATTPIEDTTVEWTTPWHRLATLTLPKQAPLPAFTAWVESLSFDPWHALVEFRPVGAMMRARNAAYRVSTQARKAASEPTELPPG
jgi:hypothetical protein